MIITFKKINVQISEHGLSGDETNNLEFNIVQKFEGEEDSDFDEDDIPPEQVLQLFPLLPFFKFLLFNHIIVSFESYK